jgi:hypothetical protein
MLSAAAALVFLIAIAAVPESAFANESSDVLKTLSLTKGTNVFHFPIPDGLNSSNTMRIFTKFAAGVGPKSEFKHVGFIIMYGKTSLDFRLNSDTRTGSLTLCFGELAEYDELTLVAQAMEDVTVEFSMKKESIMLGFTGESRRNITANNPITFLVDPVAGIDASRNDRFLLLVEDVGGSDSSKVCVIVSAYGSTCPYRDQPDNVRGAEMWLTMLERGAMTIRSETHKFNMPFFISIVVLDSDAPCRLPDEDYVSASKRLKHVSVSIRRAKPYTTYFLPILLALMICIFIVVAAIGVIKMKTYGKEKDGQSPNSTTAASQFVTPRESPRQAEGEETGENADVIDGGPGAERQEPDSLKPILNDSSTLADGRDEDIDELIKKCSNALPADSTRMDRVTKGLNRLEKNAHLSDMSKILKDDPWFRRNRSRVYCYLVPLLSIFYFIPSIQFVFLVKQSENITGTLDLCFHNFECSKPLNIFSDFNHVISNMSYVVFGFGFILCVYLKSKSLPSAQNNKNDHLSETGIMQQLSIFYAMGFALVFQGLFSVCYHVCPTNYSLQFDSTMMYVMCMLGSVKIYQFRHPDANANAYSFFYTLTLILILEALTLYSASWWVYGCFILMYIGGTIFIAIDCYYIGIGRLHHSIAFVLTKEVAGFFKKPFSVRYRQRFFFASLFALINLAHAIYAVYSKFMKPRKTVTQVVLVILAGNLFIYIAYYVFCKNFMRCRQVCRQRQAKKQGMDEVDGKYAKYYVDCPSGRIPVIFSAGSIFALVAFILGSIAFTFYIDRSANRNLSPAESRALNEPCSFYDFYDNHDIWHYSSSAAIFMAFLALLTMDDDIFKRPRDEIEVY